MNTLDCMCARKLNESFTKTYVNPIALRTAETIWSFGCSVCNKNALKNKAMDFCLNLILPTVFFFFFFFVVVLV